MAREKDCRHFFGDTEKAIGFSQVVKAGNVLYVSGVLAVDENLQVVGEGDMTAQVAQVYANLGRILSANGASFQDVVKETVFATDLAALAGALAPRRRPSMPTAPMSPPPPWCRSRVSSCPAP